MKIFSKLLLVAALVVAPALSFADNAAKSYEQLSEKYKLEIDAVQTELKANKKRQKANPGDATLKQAEAAKNQELLDLKAKKKAIDMAVDAQRECEKAQKRQHEAHAAAEKAKARVRDAKDAADRVVGSNPDKKTYQQLAEQFKLEAAALEDELKANKKRQKANPSDTKLQQEGVAKTEELKNLKERRKVLVAFMDADADNQRAIRKATEAQADAEKALQIAKDKAAEADKLLGL